MSNANTPEAPPSYVTGNDVNAQPPAYTFPTSFKIGAKVTEAPLVIPENLQAHLALLRSFYALKVSVGGTQSGNVDSRIKGENLETEPEVRWAWFVGHAVERCASLTDVESLVGCLLLVLYIKV